MNNTNYQFNPKQFKRNNCAVHHVLNNKNNFLQNKSPYSGLNNIYFKDGCPALMSDGRFLTNYISTNELTEIMRRKNGFINMNEFRNFMQNNAESIINAERQLNLKENSCLTNIACSEGWYNLWTNLNGNWASNNLS